MKDQHKNLFASASPIFAMDFTTNSSCRESIEESIKSMYMCKGATLQYMPYTVLTILFFCAIHGMRISELLNITPADHVGDHRFLVRGLKRSRSYMVHLDVRDVSPVVKTNPFYQVSIIPFTYRYIYDWCVRCGVGMDSKLRKTTARTHAHRYQTADNVTALAGSAPAGDVIHHNSSKSISYYLNKRSVSNG